MKKKLNVYFILILLITALAAFLRFYRLPSIMSFNAEQGDNYLAIKDFIENKKIPFIGPPTSHPWLHFGPLFYYLMTPVMLLANYTPLAPAYFFALIYTAMIPLNYIVVKRFFNKQTALLSSFFIAVSPIFIHFNRSARFFCLVPFLLYFYFWFLANYLEKDKNAFIMGLLLGIIINFHLTALVLIPATLSVFWFTKKNIKWKKIILGFLIPLSPLLIYDVFNGFQMISKFVLWIPYRIAGFLHLYPKNNLTSASFTDTVGGFTSFLKLSFFPKTFPWQFSTSFYLLILAGFLIIYKRPFTLIYRNIKKIFKEKNSIQIFLLFLTAWSFVALFIHTSPPLHYFLPILPLPQIFLASWLLNFKLSATVKNRILGFIIIFLSLVSANFYFSKQWYYLPKNEVSLNPHYIPYSLQTKIMKIVVVDSGEKSYSLSRIGPYDHFENNFADNYYYIGWLLGKEPIKDKPGLKYTIIENLEKIPDTLNFNQTIVQINEIAILKN